MGVQWAGINVVVFYIAVVLEVNVGLERNMALVAGGCINLAFAVGSLVPALFLDRIGRRKPMSKSFPQGKIFGTTLTTLQLLVPSVWLLA